MRATDDVCLHLAVNENHLLAGTLVVTDNLLAAHLVNKVYTLIVSLRDVVRFIIKENLTHHHTMLTKRTLVNSRVSMPVIPGTLSRFNQWQDSLHSIGCTARCNHSRWWQKHKSCHSHEGWQTVLLKSKWWHTSCRRECKCHQLTGVRRGRSNSLDIPSWLCWTQPRPLQERVSKDLPWNLVPSLKTKVTFSYLTFDSFYFILIRANEFFTLRSSLFTYLW